MYLFTRLADLLGDVWERNCEKAGHEDAVSEPPVESVNKQ